LSKIYKKFWNDSKLFGIILILLTLSFPNCKKKDLGPDIESIQRDRSLDVRSSVAKLLPIIFEWRLKDWKLNADPKTNEWILDVSYGGTTALTFHSTEEYSKDTVETHALYHLKLISALSHLPIREIRLNLTKPLYVKGETKPESEIQEFEIYRTKTDGSKIAEILTKNKNINLFDSSNLDQKKIREMIDEAQKFWFVELNELPRITLE